jgi:hypothetical protein
MTVGCGFSLRAGRYEPRPYRARIHRASTFIFDHSLRLRGSADHALNFGLTLVSRLFTDVQCGGAAEFLTGLYRQPEARPVFSRTECVKRVLDPLLNVPANVRVSSLDELIGADGQSVPSVKHFRLQPSEEAFAPREAQCPDVEVQMPPVSVYDELLKKVAA